MCRLRGIYILVAVLVCLADRSFSKRRVKQDIRALINNRQWGPNNNFPGWGPGPGWEPPYEEPTLPPVPASKFTYKWGDLCPPWPRCNVYPKCCQRSGRVGGLRYTTACVNYKKDICPSDDQDEFEFY